MSETGATGIDEYGRAYDPSDASRAKTIIAAHEDYRAWALPDGTGMPWYDLEDFRQVGEWIIPPGYQIVPAGAVTLSAEEAATAADGLSRLIARYESLANEHDRAGRTEQWLWERNNAAKYRALAAKLGGAS
jgi:hypothetical protein